MAHFAGTGPAGRQCVDCEFLDTTMREIYLAAIPFIICSLLLVALLIAFPALALWLPGL